MEFSIRISDDNKVMSKPYYKSIVYYNYSQFKSAINIGNKEKQLEALYAVNVAIELLKSITLTDTKIENSMQDYLIHKAFVSPYCGYKEGFVSFYKQAFERNRERFIKEYTEDGTGKELIFFAITHDKMDFILKDLIQLHKNSKVTLDLNVQNDFGITPILYAIDQSKNDIIKYLLELGADPLHKTPSEETTALSYAWLYEKWEAAINIIEYFSKNHQNLNIFEDFKQEYKDLELADNEFPIENRDLINNFIEQYVLVDTSGDHQNLNSEI